MTTTRCALLILLTSLGALALLAYGLAWNALSQALGFGTIQMGVPVHTRALAWHGAARLPRLLADHAHTPVGLFDFAAGGLLGCATALAWIGRSGASTRDEREASHSMACAVAWCVGIWSAMSFFAIVIPGFVALAARPEAGAFWLNQFLLTSLVLNPKLWWCAWLIRAAQRAQDRAAST